MAAFRMKLTGLPGAPWGRIFQINDNAMNRILKSARTSFGQVPVDPQAPPPGGPRGAASVPMRDMTDEETATKMFQSFVAGWIDQAFVNERSIARVTAEGNIAKDTVASETADNA